MNMFKIAKQRKIPKSVQECIIEDSVTENLWTWAKRLETMGRVIFVLIFAFGIYSSYQLADQTYEVEMGTYYTWTKTVSEFKTELFISSLLQHIFYAFIELASVHTIALLVGTAANISHSTRIASNIAVYKCMRSSSEHSDTNLNTSDSHTQEKNDSKPEERQPAFSPKNIVMTSRNTFYCPYCKAENKNGAEKCFRCGTVFEQCAESGAPQDNSGN